MSHFDSEFVQGHLLAAEAWNREAFREALRYSTARAESPLEAAFIVWWYLQGDSLGEAALLSQVDIDAYRVDFVCGIPREFQLPIDPQHCLIVELDGHDFHERTKAQVAHRNKRDRHLTALGWTVLHFSGSEFHADPMAVIDTIQAAARAVRKKAPRVASASGVVTT